MYYPKMRADLDYVQSFFCQTYGEMQIYWKANERVWIYVDLMGSDASLEDAILSAYATYKSYSRNFPRG